MNKKIVEISLVTDVTELHSKVDWADVENKPEIVTKEELEQEYYDKEETDQRIEEAIQSGMSQAGFWTSGETQEYVEGKLDDYYTSGETEEKIAEAISGISLEGYWTSGETQEWVNDVLENYVTTADTQVYEAIQKGWFIEYVPITNEKKRLHRTQYPYNISGETYTHLKMIGDFFVNGRGMCVFNGEINCVFSYMGVHSGETEERPWAKEIIIPATVKEVSMWTVSSAYTSLTIYANEPPSGFEWFGVPTMNNLFVPEGSVQDYKDYVDGTEISEEWKEKIKAMIKPIGYVEPTLKNNTFTLYSGGGTITPRVTSGWGANYVRTELKGKENTFVFDGEINTIPANAFSGNTNIKGEVFIPSYITNVGTKAFYNCSGIERLRIEDNGNPTLNSECFRGCSNLSHVKFSESITGQPVKKNVFYDCPLKTLEFSNFKEDGWYYYDPLNVSGGTMIVPDNCRDRYINGHWWQGGPYDVVGLKDRGWKLMEWSEYYAAQGGSAEISPLAKGNFIKATYDVQSTSEPTKLLQRAMDLNGTMVLQAVYIPSENEYFEDYTLTFDDQPKYFTFSATGLTDVYFIYYKESINNIEDMLFQNVTTLKKIVLPSGVEGVGGGYDGAFGGCSGLVEFTINRKWGDMNFYFEQFQSIESSGGTWHVTEELYNWFNASLEERKSWGETYPYLYWTATADAQEPEEYSILATVLAQKASALYNKEHNWSQNEINGINDRFNQIIDPFDMLVTEEVPYEIYEETPASDEIWYMSKNDAKIEMWADIRDDNGNGMEWNSATHTRQSNGVWVAKFPNDINYFGENEDKQMFRAIRFNDHITTVHSIPEYCSDIIVGSGFTSQDEHNLGAGDVGKKVWTRVTLLNLPETCKNDWLDWKMRIGGRFYMPSDSPYYDVWAEGLEQRGVQYNNLSHSPFTDKSKGVLLRKDYQGGGGSGADEAVREFLFSGVSYGGAVLDIENENALYEVPNEDLVDIPSEFQVSIKDILNDTNANVEANRTNIEANAQAIVETNATVAAFAGNISKNASGVAENKEAISEANAQEKSDIDTIAAIIKALHTFTVQDITVDGNTYAVSLLPNQAVGHIDSTDFVDYPSLINYEGSLIITE